MGMALGYITALAVHGGVVMGLANFCGVLMLCTHAAKQHGRRGKPLHGHCSYKDPSEEDAEMGHCDTIL
jgi:acyl-coenzyme A thioesterase PaaI-like protein